MKKKRIIIVSFAITILFAIAIVNDDNNESKTVHSAFENNPQTIVFNNSNSSLTQHEKIPVGNRDEILEKSLKGFREETYWGNEHAVKEKTKDLNDKEFSRFVQDEIREKDVDVYWGAEY